MNLADEIDVLLAREAAREVVRGYIRSIASDVDREIALWMHHDRISESATNQDIIGVLEKSDLQEIESFYGKRVRLAADRGRSQRNYSALRCFVREVKRARHDLEVTASMVFY